MGAPEGAAGAGAREALAVAFWSFDAVQIYKNQETIPAGTPGRLAASLHLPCLLGHRDRSGGFARQSWKAEESGTHFEDLKGAQLQ